MLTVHGPGLHDDPKNSDNALIFFSTKVIVLFIQMSTVFCSNTLVSNSCKNKGVKISLFLKPGWQYFLSLSPLKLSSKLLFTSTTTCSGCWTLAA